MGRTRRPIQGVAEPAGGARDGQRGAGPNLAAAVGALFPHGSAVDSAFHGERRKNETHESRTDPDARLFRKGNGKEAKLVHMGHALTDNRHGLVVATRTTLATGTAEQREAAAAMVEEIGGGRRITLGADKGYDTRPCVEALRECHVTPHVAQKE